MEIDLLGYKQQGIIQIGKERGFVVAEDVRRFYSPNEIHREMNKLIARGYFKQTFDGIRIKWIYVD